MREKSNYNILITMLKKLRSFLPVWVHLILRLPKIMFLMPLSFEGRATIRHFALMTEWKSPAEKIGNRAASVALEDIIDRQRVRILHPTAQNGDVTTYELYVLNCLVKSIGPKNIFEIGTLHGRTTVNLLDSAEGLETLYTLDIMEELPSNRFAGHPRADHVKRIVCDSRDLDTTPYRRRMDFVFIDADHTYDAVVNDSKKAMEMLSNPGVLVWHDYTFVSDTKRACNEFIMQYPRRRYVQIVDTTFLVMLADG